MRMTTSIMISIIKLFSKAIVTTENIHPCSRSYGNIFIKKLFVIIIGKHKSPGLDYRYLKDYKT